jgi:hypothetical protein
MKDSIVFAHLMDEYGNLDQEKHAEKSGEFEESAMKESNGRNAKAGAHLMQDEERNTGAVSWTIYFKYLRFAGGLFWAPAILFLLTASQGAQGDIYSYSIRFQF